MRLLMGLTMLLVVLPYAAQGQDDPNDVPLGDVARSMRKKAPAHPVIDDDNLTQAMQQAESRRGFGSSLRFLMAGDGSGFRVSAPDVTCNLSFTANVKSLLASQYSEMELPAADLQRLEGHAAISGDALTVSVHNSTDWHVSEISVAITVVKRNNAGDIAEIGGASQVAAPSAPALGMDTDKKPDAIVIYRMRAVGVPWAVTTFSSRLNAALASGVDWHWAIVEARGYPPESYRRGISSQATAESDPASASEPVQAAEPASQKRPEITPVSNPGEARPQLLPSSNHQ